MSTTQSKFRPKGCISSESRSSSENSTKRALASLRVQGISLLNKKHKPNYEEIWAKFTEKILVKESLGIEFRLLRAKNIKNRVRKAMNKLGELYLKFRETRTRADSSEKPECNLMNSTIKDGKTQLEKDLA